MVFRLRYLHHNFELPPGRFIIGRSTDCQLSLDDPLVSRRHALLTVTEGYVEVQDLGSRNGVVVNGQRIQERRRVDDGDLILVGSQEMQLSIQRAPDLDVTDPRVRDHVTITNMKPVLPTAKDTLRPAPPGDVDTFVSDGATSKKDAFRLLGGVADKALALGRAEEAERLLATLLDHVLQQVKRGGDIDLPMAERAGYYGAKLASATGKSAWIDYVIELYTALQRPCSAATIDELHNVVRKVKDIDLPALRAYIGMLRTVAPKFGPADKFLVQRLEGLERLVVV